MSNLIFKKPIFSPDTNYAQTQIGTPTHISPELVSGEAYDFKSDIWGLGCIIYEICCQKPPFLSKNLNDIFIKIKNADYAAIPTAYSAILSDLIRIMLKVDPTSRPTAYQLLTSRALKEDLDLYMDFVKKMPHGSGSSDGSAGTDLPHPGTRNSCRLDWNPKWNTKNYACSLIIRTWVWIKEINKKVQDGTVGRYQYPEHCIWGSYVQKHYHKAEYITNCYTLFTVCYSTIHAK